MFAFTRAWRCALPKPNTSPRARCCVSLQGARKQAKAPTAPAKAKPAPLVVQQVSSLSLPSRELGLVCRRQECVVFQSIIARSTHTSAAVFSLTLQEDPIECPLCIEPLDETDRDFFPCACG